MVAHHVRFPVKGTVRFPEKTFKSYEDVWRATICIAAPSNIKGSEEDWNTTFNWICATKKTMIPPTEVKYHGARIVEYESVTLQAFKKKVDAQWDWLNKPDKSKKKKP